MSVAPPETRPDQHYDQPTVRTRVWKHGKVVDENYPLDRVSDHLEENDKLVWIDLLSPDHRTLAKLAEEINLDPNSVEDAIAQEERAKATGYDRYTFVTAYSTGLQGNKLETCRVSAFVLDHALVTVHADDWVGLDEVVKRWDAQAELVAQNGVDALLYTLLDVIVDGQFDTIQSLDDKIDDLEEGLFNEVPQTHADQKKQFELRGSVVAFRRVVSPQTQMSTTLHRIRGERFPAMRSYWNDLDDHIARVLEWTDQARELLNNVFGANMSLQDARLNQVMKKLTAWAAIIAVPTAITGFYGQNVPYPGYSREWGFVTSISICVALMVGLYISFKKKGWF